MRKKIFDLSLANVESIVDEISGQRLDREVWLVETALKLNFQHKELRDCLRQHKNTWSHSQYRERLAFHYYNISSVFHELFRKYQVDLQSVIHWLEKCMDVTKEIPQHQMTKSLSKLSEDTKNSLNEMKQLHAMLSAMRDGYQNAMRDRYQNSSNKTEVHEFAKLKWSLGDVTKDSAISQYLFLCNKDEKTWIQQKIQNITLLKVIAYLEECISNPQCNPMSASILCFSLGKAYRLAGIPILEEKYNNTSGHLIKTCLSFKDNFADTKQNLKILILEQVKDRKNVQQVKNIIEELYNKPLTSIDQAYIERKYSRMCSLEFTEESVSYFGKLKENKNRQIIMDILPQLKLCDSLLQIPHPLNQLDYFILLKNNYNLLKPEDANKSLKMLKARCFETVIEYVELAKKELYFLEVFIEFMDSFKDTQYLEAVLDLRHFCITECPFAAFFVRILNLERDEFGPHVVAVQQAAEPLKHEKDLFYENRIKEFILSYLKSPEIRFMQLDGRGVLEVCSKKIVISEILRQERFNEILTDPSCEEVRFVGTNAIHVDENVNKSKWHGKNIVVITKTLFVHDKISWDVSESDSMLRYASEAGTLPSGIGDAGKDGEAGESGGNVLILAESVSNPDNMTIISHGGAGGKGQDGGNGRNGSPGKSIDKNSFRTKFPAAANFAIGTRQESLLATLQSMLEYNSVIKLKWYERPVTNVSKYIPGATFYKMCVLEDSICTEKNLDNIINDLNVSIANPHNDHVRFNGNIFIQAVTDEENEIEFSFERGGTTTNCQAFLLFKGSNGKPGYKGGEYGLGGQGGFPGDITIRNIKDVSSTFSLATDGAPGPEGERGKGGKYGSHGKNGCDMGYMDYSVSKFFTKEWPEWFGLEEDSKICLRYYKDDDGNRIWCPYRRYQKFSERYTRMEPCSNEHSKNRKYQERTSTRSNTERESKSKATKKKTISNSNILAHYHQQLNSIDKAFLRNIYDELDNTNAQALQAIEENQMMQDEVAINAQIMRCATFRHERKQMRHQDTVVQTDVKKNREVNVEQTIESLIRNPKPIETWLVLNEIRITNIQLKKLYRTLEIVKTNIVQTDEGDAAINYIQNLLLEKYRFICLFEISQQLQPRESLPSSAMSITDPVAMIRYLKIGNMQSNEYSHEILGRLNQYIFNNQEEERKKLSKFCKNELKYDEHALKWLKTFILEAGNFEESSLTTKNWYKKYIFFIEKEKQGLIVFPESVERLDGEFISHLFSKIGNRDGDRPVIADFIRFIEKKGSESVCCLELLAYTYNVNIRLYNAIESEHFNFVLKENFNPDTEQRYHLLIECDKRTPLEIDVDFWKLEQQRKSDCMRYSKIISDTEQCKKKEELDSYLAMKTYNERFIMDDELGMLPMSVSDMKTIVDMIIGYFTSIEDKMLVGPQLYKLSPEYIGRTDILENINRRFSVEGNHISAQELLRLINSVLHSAVEGRNIIDLYRWIVIAYPQDQWINELLLTDVETLFKKSLPDKTKWRRYLLQIKNKAILIVLRDKIHTLDTDKSLSVGCIGDIFYLLSKIPTEKLQMGELDLAEWPYALKERYWKYRLSGLMKWNDVDLSTSAYYTLSIENMYGSDLIEQFIRLLIDKKFKITPSQISSILSNFNDERWNLSDVELKILSNCSRIDDWIEKMQNDYFGNMKVRDIESLVKLISVNANTSATVKTLLPNIQHQLNTILLTDFSSVILEKTETGNRSVHKYCEADITNWVRSYKNKIKSFRDESEKRNFLDRMNGEALAVINRGIQLKRGFPLRDTQTLTALILLQNARSTLAQVATGEGKSLIVVAASIIKALKGEKVDIITSSSVLAKRDAQNNADIYNLFNINVSHNCNEDIEVRKAAYSGNQVVYGDLSDFQRDYLLHEFYNINVLGDRNLESVVVDEVDSMLLDKGNNMLYLSHGIPGLDKLESLYLYIWQWINRPCFDRAGVLRTFDAKAMKESVLYDLFGFIGKMDIKALDARMTTLQASAIWERLVQFKIIDSKSRPITDVVNRSQIEKALYPDFTRYVDRLSYLVSECLSRDKQIHVPNCLKPFIELHLEKWIANAIKAYFMKAGEDYVVDVDRTGTSADRNPNITIIDKDTGTDQANSQWVEALHQFLQLKHNCKLSVQSLKAVFVSNVSYFKLYDHLYGLTGTLGSRGERKLLEDVHEADFVTIPTAKPKQFYEHLPIVCSGEEAWCQRIKEVSERYVWKQKRSVLIVCESVNDVETLRQALGEKETFIVHTYTREYEEFDVTQSQQKLGPGHIIIATNLAGRGTDIKINEDLKSAGGLHVILSYLPNNARIEQQAFGRSARCGDEGSGQLIIKSYEVGCGASAIIKLKNRRDREELERISKIKLYYENQIRTEERCFSKFKLQYKALGRQLRETQNGGVTLEKAPKEVQDILLHCCIDKWALWLDENGKLIDDLSNSKSRNDLEKSLTKFISQLANLKCDSVKDWIAWVDCYPVPMVKLAKYFIRIKQFDTAVTLFDSVIQKEPNFCAVAHYYKAGALGNMINWEFMSETDNVVRRQLENELLHALKAFDKLGNEAMKNAAIVSKLKCANKQSIIQIDAYEEQCKNIAHLYNMFSHSIGDIIGHAVMPQSFNNYEVKEALASKLHQHFLRDGILNNSVVARHKMSPSEMEVLSCGYGIPLVDLNNFLNKWDGKTIKSFRGFKADMKHNLCIPSKEKFWKELIRVGILSSEIKYLIVDDKKLSEIDPSLLDSLNGICQDLPKHELLQEDGYLFLNSEQLSDQKTRSIVFVKKDFVDLIGRERYFALKTKEIFCFNSKCRLETVVLKSILSSNENCMPPTYFSSYDCISVRDFVMNNVSEKEAEVILQELVEQQILEMRTGSYYYRLASNFSQIDDICLTCPVYEAITKSLLYTRFAYRIAFQKIISQIDGGTTVSLQLKTKPYLSLFWDLYETKVISPIRVGKGKHSKESVQNALSLKFNNAEFIQLLNQDECVPVEETEGLMSHLITKKWLNILIYEYGGSPAILEVNKLKEARETLDRKYKTYEKTALKILDDLLELSSESIELHIIRCLGRLKSNLESLDVPSFGFKAITEACAEGNFSNAQELYNFITNGLDEIIILEEKKYTLRMILSTTLVICMGICQIAIGAIIDMWSVGAMTYVGNAFISEGISDIIFALGAIRSGYFSWKDYGNHKIESLVITVASAGIGACWSRGTKLSRVGNKLCTPGTMIGELRASETVGAQVLRTANKSVGKEIIKQISLKTLEGVGFGLANMGVDTAVDSFLTSLCEGMASEIMTNVETELKSHRISSILKNAFQVFGENDSRAMITDVTQKFFGKTNEWKELESLAGKIFTSVSRGISEATAKKVSAGQSAGKLSLVVQHLSHAMVWVDRVRHLLEVRQLTARLLDDLSKEIEKKISCKVPAEAISNAESNYERFEKDIIDDLKTQLSAKSGQIISQRILNPLLKEGAHTLVRYGGRKIKDFYRSFKEGGYTELFEQYKRQYEESVEKAGDDIQAVKAITKEYHENLLALLSKTRNPRLFADIVRENVPMDMTCLQAYIKVLPYILQRQGIRERIRIIVENDGNDVKQVFETGTEDGSERVIRLRVKDNHFEVVGSDGTSMQTQQADDMSNNCLFWALSEQMDLGMTDLQFRSTIAMVIQEDQEMQSTIQKGWHQYGISLKMHGGAHPYERVNDWSFDPEVDLDLCKGEWVDTGNGKKWQERKLSLEELHSQRTEAYRKCLQRINEIVSGRSQNENWSKCKLIKPHGRIRPDDFESTILDTIRVTKDFGSIGSALYPVEFKTEILVKQGEDTIRYEVEINTDTVYRDQNGPQGPHIGFKIKRFGKQGPKTVTGHCLINKIGNEHLPHRANECENVRGIYYVSDQLPERVPRISIRSLFYERNRKTTYLEREDNQSPRNRSYPTSHY